MRIMEVPKIQGADFKLSMQDICLWQRFVSTGKLLITSYHNRVSCVSV